MEALPWAPQLQGSVAVAVGGISEVGENLWVLQPGGRLVERVDVPFRPGGFQNPMLIVDDYILFTAPEGTYRLRLDLAEPAEQIAEESLLVPDAATDTAWIVGCCEPQWFAPFDGSSGAVGERTNIEAGFGWPLAGYRGGLLFQPNDTRTHGRIAYWPARGEPEPFDLPITPQTALGAVTGDLAILYPPGPVVNVVDLRTREQVSSLSLVEAAAEGLTGICASPDATLVAVASTDSVEIWDIAGGTQVGRVETSRVTWIGGWTAPGQFVFLAETNDETRLKAFDVESGSAVNIARLAAPGTWRVTTSGLTC